MTGVLRILAVVLFGLAFAHGAVAQSVLRVSAIPDEARTELQRKFKPLGDYLAQDTGMQVEFTRRSIANFGIRGSLKKT